MEWPVQCEIPKRIERNELFGQSDMLRSAEERSGRSTDDDMVEIAVDGDHEGREE